MVPTLTILPSDLVGSAREALERAIEAGGNRITLGEMLCAIDP
jgi:hypothetical protein